MKKYTFLLLCDFLAFSLSPLTAQQWTGPNDTNNSISRTGRVGIGVADPAQSLHVGGNLQLEGNSIRFGSNSRLTKDNRSTISFKSDNPNNSQLVLRDSTNVVLGRLVSYRNINTGATNVSLRDAENKSFLIAVNTLNFKYSALQVNNRVVLAARIFDEGTATESRRIGINTANPRRELDVRGNAVVNQLYVNTNSAGGFDTDEYKLFVDGKAAFEEVRVQLSQNWGDYVFAPNYKLRSLPELQAYINKHGHLPTMPSAEEIGDGIEVSDIIHRQMVTIEELTLHTINQQTEIDALKEQVKQLIKTVEKVASKKK